MQFLSRLSLAALFGISLVLPANAQNRLPPEQPTSISATAPRTLTGKERLGRKWMDEQRIDNCNVPIDMRGSRPRPSLCPHVPTS
jgi:hypothetical protein